MAEKEKEDKTSQNNNAPQKDFGTARDTTQEQMYEKVINSYKETIVHMKWFINLAIMIGLAFVSIGLFFIIYIGVVKTIEINKWEKKADATISTIDTKVNTALKNIEDKGNEKIDYMTRKAKLYLDIVTYWNEAGNALQKGDRETADKFFDKINELGEKERDGETDEDSFKLIPFYDLFKIRAASMTANIPKGDNLFEMSKKEQDEQKKKQLLENVEKAYLKEENRKPGSASYKLACINAYMNNEDECRKWLKKGERGKTLPTKKYAEQDEDLKSVREKDWFKEIKWADKH